MTELTTRQIAQLDDLDIYTKEMEFGSIIDILIKLANTNASGISALNAVSINDGSPVNALASSNNVNIAGVVIHGETVTIDNPEEDGEDVYEFVADAALSVADPANIAVDITAVTTQSTINLTIDTQVTAGDTMTLGTKEYTFVPAGTDNAEGEISVGTDLATCQAAIVAAVNGTDDHNTANDAVSLGAFAANVSAVTALIGGVAGDSIATTSSFTTGTNLFAAATLASGADCSAANAVTALALAITTSDTQGVAGTDGAGDTVALEADVMGVIGNAIEIEVSGVNLTVDNATFENGVDGTVGTFEEIYRDSSYVYFCSEAANTIADDYWRRISLGSKY